MWPEVVLLIELVPGPGQCEPTAWWRKESEACAWGTLGRCGAVGRSRRSGPEVGLIRAAGYAVPATFGGARA
ncbi:hypothetical protein NDU88_003022 [Pleurodeles waltl]|uniref:Uncharacterized protein n=1 Tax=Pleurodeles waltl TaxID=8319 RepID=A0AAV7RF50_PLEWA|nr:hypothetical protein NDU88_003022 [Pleurodeles waltl]